MGNSTRKRVVKRAIAYVLAAALTLSMISVPNTDAYAAKAAVKKITVTNVKKNKVTLTKGKSFQLKTKVTTTGKISKAVTYTSSNKKVVSVTKKGKIKALKNGTAKITIKSKANKKKVCKITVKVTTPVKSVKLDKTSVTLDKGKTATLKATVSPSTASDKGVTWTSSNTKVATVSAGKITAVGAGKATITVVTKSGKKKATCVVTVNAPASTTTQAAVVKVTGVALSDATKSVTVGDTFNLTATVAPANATNKAVTWTSSDTKVATVDATGKVTAVAAGKANVTATAADGSGKSAVCAVTVAAKPVPVVKVTGVTVTLSDETVYAGGTITATAKVEPENATDPGVSYTLSMDGVTNVDTYATIDSATGKITAKNAGKVTVRATSVDGTNLYGEASFEIKATPTVSFTSDSYSVTKDESKSLAITNTSGLDVVYSSSDETCVTVDASGKVTGVSAGTATITVSLKDYPTAKDTCTVKVIDDSSVIITDVTAINTSGVLSVKVQSAKQGAEVSSSSLEGTKLYLVNTETNQTIEATYSKYEDGLAYYEFDSSDLPSGKASYTVSAADDSILAVSPSNGSDSLEVDSEVTALETGIYGVVCDENGDPIEGAKVCLGDSVDDRAWTTYSDENGHYEMQATESTGWTLSASKDGFFETVVTNDDAIAVSGQKTSCVIEMESINENQLTIWGQVSPEDGTYKFDDNSSKRPVASLYVMVDNEYKLVAYTDISQKGYYAFVNSDKKAIESDAFSKYSEFEDESNYAILSDFSYVLETDKMYKVEISKGLDSSSTSVYYAVESSGFTLNTTSKYTQVEDMTIAKVSEFKGITIPQGAISWAKDNVPSSNPVVECELRTSDGSAVVSDWKTVSLDGNLSDAATTFFADAEKKYTLPEGQYTAVFMCGEYANIYKTINILADGSVSATLSDIMFTNAGSYSLKVAISIANNDYLANLDVGDEVRLRDLLGNVSEDKNVGLSATLYDITDGNETFTYDEEIDTFKVEMTSKGGKEIVAEFGMRNLIDGNKYRVKFSSSVLSISDTMDKPYLGEIVTSEGYFEFTKVEEVYVNSVTPTFEGRANIESIKFPGKTSYFENYVNSDGPLFVSTVTLRDAAGNDVAAKTVNKYYSCGNLLDLSKADQSRVSKDSVYGGGDLADDGIDVSDVFSNISVGDGYTIEIKVNGYEPTVVPVEGSGGISIKGLTKGSYDVPADVKFSEIKDTYIYGSIKVGNDLVEDSVDITVLTADGTTVVGTYTAVGGQFTIVNDGETVVIGKDETYVLVFRADGYSVAKATVTCSKTANEVGVITLAAKVGTILATVKNENGVDITTIDNDIKQIYAVDENYVDVNDETLFVNNTVKTNYEDDDLFENGRHEMSYNGEYWAVGNVPKAKYYVYIDVEKGSKNYQSTKSTESATIVNGNQIMTISDVVVPNAKNDATGKVTVTIKKDSGDYNKKYYDFVRVYKVNTVTNSMEFVKSVKVAPNGGRLTRTCEVVLPVLESANEIYEFCAVSRNYSQGAGTYRKAVTSTNRTQSLSVEINLYGMK